MSDDSRDDSPAARLEQRLAARHARIGVIGLGYVGLPLALVAVEAGFPVTGFDINPQRVADIASGRQVIKYIPATRMAAALATSRFAVTEDFAPLAECDAILICVPTPLTRQREPDLSFVEETARAIARTLRPGQLVVLESTTWPGTTAEVVKPILEAGGLVCGQDFFLAFSPEREDPGNAHYSTATIPKVVGGEGEAAGRLASALYRDLVTRVVPVSSTQVAEAAKLTENIFRSVNIALVNELKTVYAAMGIDIWEVLEAAATKPFGFMPFYPGPGLGGHCIPIDPFYLTWKAREFDIETRFIELAGQINTRMPYLVVDTLAEALDRLAGRGLSGARILVLGVAYKKNVDDVRESPALKLMELIDERGGECAFHDPFVAALPPTRRHGRLSGKRSVPLTAELLDSVDAVLVATDHDEVDYALVAAHARVLVDTRNVFAKAGLSPAGLVKA
ncbi:nucleotide sugar dehydrogenase [Ancylobacter amanitiformis]|uniref:UDP-N-acetyl-D-glucosamine dehydrogenase n=1 Tax=Ancylobacter amanitiformis TaxID=217069 RepID=A0ABU0LSU7_9HYPH|nr:nucleotide sugar dehydrogenase [Ancylobacter amanitiformis]MDQ0511789.1 UDP-N-acetyl-D-glucosamine dehydrogenase [Ancylobacter amanitiformis]